jgi:hypothetical protein
MLVAFGAACQLVQLKLKNKAWGADVSLCPCVGVD